MCFSAPASFIAGTVLSAAGVVTVSKIKKKREIPLALIPLLFGVQQLIEGVIWLSLTHSLSRLNTIATYSFVMFSHVLWPVFVPIAVLLIEPNGWRKKAIMVCGSLGALTSAYMLFLILFFPVSSQIHHHSIEYIFPSLGIPFAPHALFYIIATCVSCLLSSHTLVRWLGISTSVFLAIAYYFYTTTFASVWCFFAAILSIIIYYHFKRTSKISTR